MAGSVMRMSKSTVSVFSLGYADRWQDDMQEQGDLTFWALIIGAFVGECHGRHGTTLILNGYSS